MFKWISWFGRTMAVAVIASFLSVWTTGFIVNSYVETLLKQYGMELENRPVALTGMWGGLWGVGQQGAEQGTAQQDVAAQEQEPPLATESGSGSGTKANAGITVDEMLEGDVAVPAWGSDEPVMTSEEIADTKGQMNEQDKQELFMLLMTKLPQDAWQTISEYMENGLTETELQEVQQIVAKHLNDEEYGQLMDILKKY